MDLATYPQSPDEFKVLYNTFMTANLINCANCVATCSVAPARRPAGRSTTKITVETFMIGSF
jgi:hypothetical protein